MAFFGPLLGYGASGLVFAHAGDEDQVIKLVYLPDRDPEQWEEFANQQQAKLFEELADMDETPIGLPKVYHYMEGEVGPWLEEEVTNQIADPEAQRIFDVEFWPGRKFALWMIENVPHREENMYGSYESPNEQIPEVWSLNTEARMGWRTRDYQNNVPFEQGHYRDMSTWLLDHGYLVRDVKHLRNLGYRHAGTPVWYDPNVVTWPLETKEDQEAFDVIFTGFSPESIQNEITSGHYVENRRNAEDLDHNRPLSKILAVASTTMGPADTEYLNAQILQECINYVYFWPPLHPDPDYQVDSCSGTGGDHKYSPVGKWKMLGNLRSLHDHWPEGWEELKSLSPLHEEGELYQITCENCNWEASASVEVEKTPYHSTSATGEYTMPATGKIITFYSLDSSGHKVWQDPNQEIWYSHTKPAMLDSQGEIKNIPS
jgi:hypothetical protein